MGVGNNAVGSSDTWDGPIDELRIDKYASSVDWARSSYENQKPNSSFLKIDNFKGTPVFDSTIKAIFAKKGVAISAFTPIVATGGTKAFSAVGLPPGISINTTLVASGLHHCNRNHQFYRKRARLGCKWRLQVRLSSLHP